METEKDELEIDRICPVCRKEGTQLCAACRKVTYCCRDHQKEHWKQHKSECRPFEIKHSQELGRYLLCKRNIDIDDTIINEGPLAFGPKISNVQAQCLGCYQPIDIMNNTDYKTCPRCHWPVCDNICVGLISQEHHVPECLVLRLNTDIADNKQFCYEAITPLRCLLLQKKNPRKWQQLIAMESHFNKRQKGTEAFEEAEKISNYLRENFISRLDDGALPDMSKNIIHAICGIIEVNALEITTGQGEVAALYPTACLMEHNCLSNTKYSFNLEDFKITVFAAFDIKKSEHISTMYTHLLWGTEARQEHLRSTKYFTCKCKRCLDPTELGTHLSTLKCIGVDKDDVTKRCDGQILPQNPNKPNDEWKCNKCPASLNSEHVIDLMSRLALEVDSAMENPSISKLEKLLKSLEKMVHKNHYHCFMANHSLIQLYGREPGFTNKELRDEVLDWKIDKCRNLLEIINVLDRGHARVVLYTAVIFVEFFSALYERSQRLTDPCEKQRCLIEGKGAIEKCVLILKNEPLFSAGFSMINIAKGNLIKVKKELEKFKIIEL